MRRLSTTCFLFLSCLILIQFSQAHKILVFSAAVSRSHVLSNARIADTLAEAGHNVTLLEVLYRKLPDTVKVRFAKRIILSNVTANSHHRPGSDGFKPDESLYAAITRPVNHFSNFFVNICDEMLTNYREFLLSLRDDEFDILMTEQLDTCAPSLKHVIQAKSFIWISSCPLMEFMGSIVGVHAPTSFVPASITSYPDISDKMTLYQRIRNTIEHYKGHQIFENLFHEITVVYRKHFGEDFPSVLETHQNVTMIFALGDEFLSFPRPILHNIIYVGGGGMDGGVKQELTEPYLSEMEKGAKGVVLFSLGSVTETKDLPSAAKKNFYEAFASFTDYNFIVKIDEDDKEFIEILSKAPNVKIAHWMPQPAILAHYRLRLFITHGGYNSLLETVHAGKPVILLPFFADQWTNGRLAERNKFGRVFDKRLLLHSSEEFRQLLADALLDSSLQENVLRIRQLIRTKPMSGTERLLKYTEFVGVNREFPELHVSGRKMSIIEYHNLDIIALVLAGGFASVVIVVVVLVFTIRTLFSVFSSRKTVKND